MQELRIKVSDIENLPPWNTVLSLIDELNPDSWLLVGGLMVQMHAMIAGYQSRATKDIDMLVDVMADTSNVKQVITTLERIGFEKREPGLRGAAFHRLRMKDLSIDVLIADHLPSGKRKSAVVDVWPMMEIAGGAQAIERRMSIVIETRRGDKRLFIPNLLGALILKSAAYGADRRNRDRHLEDVALLASFITDHADTIRSLHGSDKKRLRTVCVALDDPNHRAWLKLDAENRQKGQDTLRILSA
jgi:hypothetical protein